MPGAPETDQDLIDAANAGDAAAFERLYLRYRDWVTSLALRLGGDRETALDVMQETFIVLLRRFPGFELRAQLKTYLYPIVRGLVVTAGRTAQRERRALSRSAAAPPPAAAETAPENARALARILEELGPAHREVVILRFADGLALQEIAEALGVPLGTVKSRLHHALRLLRESEATRQYFDE